eukprot:12925136-Prorocentrum_lima.AAC.1
MAGPDSSVCPTSSKRRRTASPKTVTTSIEVLEQSSWIAKRDQRIEVLAGRFKKSSGPAGAPRQWLR